MGLIEAPLPVRIIVGIEDGDLARLLDHLHPEIPKKRTARLQANWLLGVGYGIPRNNLRHL
jgi:hypothetical protein